MDELLKGVVIDARIDGEEVELVFCPEFGETRVIRVPTNTRFTLYGMSINKKELCELTYPLSIEISESVKLGI